jgi:hypothetical protein
MLAWGAIVACSDTTNTGLVSNDGGMPASAGAAGKGGSGSGGSSAAGVSGTGNPVAGSGGGGSGGAGSGGAPEGGGGAIQCPKDVPTTSTFTCADMETWAPEYDFVNGAFYFNVGRSIPFPILKGTLVFRYTDFGQECRTWTVYGKGMLAVAQSTPRDLRDLAVMSLHLEDVCANEYDFAPGDATACAELQGSSTEAVWPLACKTAPADACPLGCSSAP